MVRRRQQYNDLEKENSKPKDILVSWHKNKFGIFEDRNEALIRAALVRGMKESSSESYSGPCHAGPHRHGRSLDFILVAVGNH